MGYDPSEEKSSRYYTVGFGTLTANVPLGAAYSSALNSGLNQNECLPSAMPQADSYYFLAGKRVASRLADHLDIVPATSIGIQDDDSTQTFTAAAGGVIHKKFTGTSQSSLMTINQAKVIRIIRNGF